MLFFFVHLPNDSYDEWTESEGNLFRQILKTNDNTKEITPRRLGNRKKSRFNSLKNKSI